MRLVRVRAGVCAPCTHVYSPFSVFEHTYMCTYTHTHAHTHTFLLSFRSLLILRFSPFFSSPSAVTSEHRSAPGKRRTCSTRGGGFSHSRLLRDTRYRRCSPRAFGEQESDAITKTQITGAPGADRLAAIILDSPMVDY